LGRFSGFCFKPKVALAPVYALRWLSPAASSRQHR
jgi:hypothetical protein